MVEVSVAVAVVVVCGTAALIEVFREKQTEVGECCTCCTGGRRRTNQALDSPVDEKHAGAEDKTAAMGLSDRGCERGLQKTLKRG